MHTRRAEASQKTAERKLKASEAFHREQTPESVILPHSKMPPQLRPLSESTRRPNAANHANDKRRSTEITSVLMINSQVRMGYVLGHMKKELENGNSHSSARRIERPATTSV